MQRLALEQIQRLKEEKELRTTSAEELAVLWKKGSSMFVPTTTRTQDHEEPYQEGQPQALEGMLGVTKRPMSDQEAGDTESTARAARVTTCRDGHPENQVKSAPEAV